MDTRNELLLCNFDNLHNKTEDLVLAELWSANWSISNQEKISQIVQNIQDDSLKQYFEDRNIRQDGLIIAIKCFLTYKKVNFDPNVKSCTIKDYLSIAWPAILDPTVKLQCDSETIYPNIQCAELLFLTLSIFKALCDLEDNNVLYKWWHLRAKISHQQALEDTSATLYSHIKGIANSLLTSVPTLRAQLKVLLLTEISQAYLLYGRVQKCEEYMAQAMSTAGLSMTLKGALGKRTKHQIDALSQLALSIDLDNNYDRVPAEKTHNPADLPTEVELQDDVRLNKVEFIEELKQAELPSLEQVLCLLHVQHAQKAQPKDNLLEEELKPYIDAILSQPTGPWAVRVGALLIRCKLESTHKRTVERAMLQCEAVVADTNQVAPTSRLSYIWASSLQASWTWRQHLADLYLSLGLVKAALEEYLHLQLWEDVIACYTVLQLRHKAAEIIQQQLDVKPTVKLYCLLGDATDDIKCYEKAWEFSGYKSGRAQRHWGNYLYDRKMYEECIPHFEKSLEINSLQERVWLRLGFAALTIEKWSIAAKAYQRYTHLHPTSFEAWNNLAKVYVKLNDKERAYRALMESLRYNYDNWKLWENIVVISMDTGHFEDVLRGVHRLLDLRSQFEDKEVLNCLVAAIVQDKVDAQGNGAARLRKRALELFGRITSVHLNNPELWQLYADLSPTSLLKGQRLLKAYRGYMQNGNWSNSPDTCQKVIEMAQNLLVYSMQARKDAENSDVLMANQQLSSARLTGQAVLRAAEKQNWAENAALVDQLKIMYENVTEYMKSVM